MTKLPRIVGEVSESEIARIAYILGESSAAAHALFDLHKRRGDGEDVVCYRTNMGVLLVGPRALKKG